MVPIWDKREVLLSNLPKTYACVRAVRSGERAVHHTRKQKDLNKSQVRTYRLSRQRHRPSVTSTENYDDIISKKMLTGGKRKTRNKKP